MSFYAVSPRPRSGSSVHKKNNCAVLWRHWWIWTESSLTYGRLINLLSVLALSARTFHSRHFCLFALCQINTLFWPSVRSHNSVSFSLLRDLCLFYPLNQNDRYYTPPLTYFTTSWKISDILRKNGHRLSIPNVSQVRCKSAVVACESIAFVHVAAAAAASAWLSSYHR